MHFWIVTWKHTDTMNQSIMNWVRLFYMKQHLPYYQHFNYLTTIREICCRECDRSSKDTKSSPMQCQENNDWNFYNFTDSPITKHLEVKQCMKATQRSFVPKTPSDTYYNLFELVMISPKTIFKIASALAYRCWLMVFLLAGSSRSIKGTLPLLNLR